eukprot:TRINITY_DN44389_c0_g1_i1.p1 TRINITY_DN44389_c0_g1~~TRINITY_DN44389_c0_g1_i1.p1  ORF type:complete len:169 (+),score=35.58 TRINITY_DN44389_c0_g1_i1:76-582(+)
MDTDGQVEDVYEPVPPPPPPPPAPASSELIRAGFRINWMNMRDASTGQILWEQHDWDLRHSEIEAKVPRDILKCKQVSREINFSSVESMTSLYLVQTVHFNGVQIEELSFPFGFVIPNSTNTWQQTIVAADDEEMIPAEQLSGNVVFATTFYDEDVPLITQNIRLWYV